MSPGTRTTTDRNLLLILVGSMLLIFIGVSVLARTTEDNDMRPSVENTGAAGTKAAYLALQELGIKVTRLDSPLSKLSNYKPENTTLLLLEPTLSMEDRKEDAAEVKSFLERGGRVLLTGGHWASLLPGGQVQAPGSFAPKLCYSTPEGPGELARVGETEMRFGGGWQAAGPQFRIEQRCGNQPIVVRFPVGKGEAIWWTSSTPITNAGLRTENNLKLVLASLGSNREVVFDEYVQNAHGSKENLFAGLPRWSLLAQFAAAFALLVFSFSRRKGPMRLPVELPRSSPVEFATSMGDLYEKGGATLAATDAAKRRLVRVLHRDAGITRTALDEGPNAVADGLQIRFGGNWDDLAKHLRSADAARSEPLNAKSALALVKAMREDELRVQRALRPGTLKQIDANGTTVGSKALMGKHNEGVK